MDPFGNVIGPAIARVGGTLYDAGAHLTGLYPPMSPERRADLYGQTPVDSAQQPPASRLIFNFADQNIPGPKMADIQANTPTEQITRKVTGAVTAGGGGGVGSALVAAGGALAGDVASRFAPDWLAPGAELAANYLGGKAVQKAVSPVNTVTTPERQRFVEMLDAEGVPLTAGERTGSKPLMKTEQVLGQTPGSAGGVAADVATQQAEINRAVARRAGLNTDTLTPEVLNDHRNLTLGPEIDRLATSNNMQLPTPFLQQLGQVRQGLRYMKTEAAQEIGARLDQLRDMITVDPAGNPIIAGSHYQTLMSQLRDAITGADGTARSSMLQFRDMLRQQMEASMNPADAARWRELNRLYANTAVIQDAMGGAGAGTAEGNISLLNLRGAINRSLGSDAYGKGFGDLNDLARAGQSVLRKPADSGTPQGTMINKLLTGSSILSAGAGSQLGGFEGAMIGAATPFVLPWAVGTAIRGRIPGTEFSPGQAYLTNRIANGLSPAALTAAIQAANDERRRHPLMVGYRD
jgi:hypothetical protein